MQKVHLSIYYKDCVKSVPTSVSLFAFTYDSMEQPLDISKNVTGQSCHNLYEERLGLGLLLKILSKIIKLQKYENKSRNICCLKRYFLDEKIQNTVRSVLEDT